jgi:hypothetical protein
MFILLLFTLNTQDTCGQQSSPNSSIFEPSTEWPEIPGLHHGGPITLTNEKIFIRVASAAALSYIIAKYVVKPKSTEDYYQFRTSLTVGEYKTVLRQHIGVERRIAPWFAVALEFSLQQWFDERKNLESKNKFGMGIGLQPYFRWHILGSKKWSPFLEYGTGFFQGFEKFPHTGTHFTFSHSSHIGIEYTNKKGSKFRLSYGQFHYSNNDWWEVNPSYNGNGLNFTYAWKL